MANIITLANVVTVKGTKGAGVWQAVEEAADISAFDRLDLQVAFLAQAPGGANPPDGCSIKLYTSMQNTSDIDDAWGGLGNPVASASFAVETPVAWKNVIVQADTAALLRYLRWYVAFSSETAQVTFSIQGMGRQR